MISLNGSRRQLGKNSFKWTDSVGVLAPVKEVNRELMLNKSSLSSATVEPFPNGMVYRAHLKMV